MHIRRRLLPLALLAGCGGGGGSDDPDATPADLTDAGPGDDPDAGGPTGPAPRYLFTAALGGFSVSAIEPATGALRPVGFESVDGYSEVFAWRHPDGRFMAAVSDKLHIMELDAQAGRLDDVAGSPFDVVPINRALAFHPDGELLFAGLDDDTLHSYAFDPDSGDVSPLPDPPSLGGPPIDLVVHPGGELLYVTTSLGGSAYELDAFGVGDDGTLSHLDGFPSVADDRFLLTMSPTGQLVASGDRNVHVYDVDAATGELDEISGSPVERDLAIGRPGLSPAGDVLYLPRSDDLIEGFAVGGGLADTPESPYIVRSGTAPRWVTVDPTGAFVYAGSSAGEVEWFERAGDGVLTHRGYVHGWFPTYSNGGEVVMGDAPVAFVPRRLYAFEYGVGLHTYAIDPGTGELDEMGDPLETDLSFRQMAVRPQGDALYAVDTSAGLSAWRIGGNGALVEMDGSPIPHGGAPRALGLVPSGSWMFVARSTQPDVLTRALTSDGIVAGPVGVLTSTPSTPIEVKSTPTGGNVWTCNTGDDTLEVDFFAYQGTVSAGDTPIALGAGSNPTAVAFSPDGRHGYVVLEGTGEVAAFVNSPMNDNPTEIDRYDAGTNPHAVAVHPSGKYVYVSDTGLANGGDGDSILAYQRNVKTGALTPLSPKSFPCLPRPWAMEVDPSGTFLVVGSTGTTDPVQEGGVSVLRIAEDGTLGPPDDTVLSGGVFALSILGERD